LSQITVPIMPTDSGGTKGAVTLIENLQAK